MKKTLIHIICSFIPIKRWRKKARNKLLYWVYFAPEAEYPDNSFYDCEIREKSVLIVEPNPFHGEILPGFAKYFQDLGFNVDLFLRPRNMWENPFCDYPQDELPRFFAGNAEQLKKWLQLEKTAKYEYIFFSTSAYGVKYYTGTDLYLKYLGFPLKARKGLLLLEHNFFDLEKSGEAEYLREGRLFVLWPFRDVPFLNPHYFGEKKIETKNAKTRFFAVGIALDRDCFGLIIEAVKALSLENRNFELILVGRGASPKIPERLSHYVKFKGGLDFAAMFEEIRASDFLLLPLSYATYRHHEFLRGKVSGTNQLMLGFSKPCLLEEAFARAYSLTEKNAVIYDNACGLAGAMRRAMEMGPEEYDSVRKNLKTLADELYERSLDNLRKALRKAESNNQKGLF
ncbi:MAG: glycosyltransferase family 4 protein [Acidaminococcales bacterium]|jgi:hypothetical protein|nr:glycosyltransferase family 4 protein [Acidaminococcales bacterium]